jgi:hypothetical protein
MRRFERARDLSRDAQRVRADVVNLADVRMIERRDRTRFLLEPRPVVALQPLDRHDTIEPCVPRLPHLPIPPAPILAAST